MFVSESNSDGWVWSSQFLLRMLHIPFHLFMHIAIAQSIAHIRCCIFTPYLPYIEIKFMSTTIHDVEFKLAGSEFNCGIAVNVLRSPSECLLHLFFRYKIQLALEN